MSRVSSKKDKSFCDKKNFAENFAFSAFRLLAKNMKFRNKKSENFGGKNVKILQRKLRKRND